MQRITVITTRPLKTAYLAFRLYFFYEKNERKDPSNNSDNREKLRKVSKTLGITGFIGLFRVSCFRDTLTPFCHVFVTPKYLQKNKKATPKLVRLKQYHLKKSDW